MEIKYTEQELNSIDKSLLIKMFLNLQNQMETLTVETKALNDKMQQMMEQLVLANNNRFGRKTESKRSNPCTYKSPEKFDITIIIQLHKLYDFNKLYNSYNYHKFFRRL